MTDSGSDAVGAAVPDDDDRVAPSSASSELGAGTYEVLQQRLDAAARELTDRAGTLNQQRLDTFGASTLEMLGSSRLRTEHSCVARDLVQVGDVLVFGFNVVIGLKETTAPADVFALHRLEGIDGGEPSLTDVAADDAANFLSDPRFEADFVELYRFYKAARLLDLVNTGERLLAVFQTGATIDDIRVFRWRVTPEGIAEYIDNRGDRDYRFPPRFDFSWTETTRADHRSGRRPTISVLDEVFVDPTGGRIEFRAENNTESGELLLRESVQESEQSLADCLVEYAAIDSLIVLRVLPYREEAQRGYVYNRRTHELVRLDAVAVAAQRLPEDHGLIFPGGYYLTDGSHRAFDVDTVDMEFESVTRSPNGEDVLYTFVRRSDGSYVLLSYNQVRKEVHTPILCHGVCLFDDGHLVVFRDLGDEAGRVHPMQVWETPYLSDEVYASRPQGTGPLVRIGNADLVRGISDCFTVARMARAGVETRRSYEDLLSVARRVLDSHHWLADPNVGDLADPLHGIEATAGLVLDEFEQVQALRSSAATAVEEARRDQAGLAAAARGSLDDPSEFTGLLSRLREHRGRLVTLRDERYVDLDAIAELEESLVADFDRLAGRTVEFLADRNAFEPFAKRLESISAAVAEAPTTTELQPSEDALDQLTRELEVLSDVVTGLDVADPTQRTAILEAIAEVVGGTNTARARLGQRRTDLASSEGRAEFGAEFALIAQSVSGAVAQATTPERCDEQLGRLLVALENLESRFGAVAEFADQIHDQRDDVYDAFTARKQALLDERLQTAERLAGAADRVIGTITRRSATFESPEEVGAFFAGDPMVERLRALADELRDLGEAVRADELVLRLASAAEQAQRGLRDRLDIYEDGGEVIRLGAHRFSVNSQALEPTLVPTDEGMDLLLTGTDYRESVDLGRFGESAEFAGLRVISESADVTRAEYLATTMLLAAADGTGVSALGDLEDARAAGSLIDVVRAAIEERFDEGYERGVHDHDAAAILDAMLPLWADAGLRRVVPEVRAAAQIFWARGHDDVARRVMHAEARSAAALAGALGDRSARGRLVADLAVAFTSFASEFGLGGDAAAVAEYLVDELSAEVPDFVSSQEADEAVREFGRWLDEQGLARVFAAVREELADDPAAEHEAVIGWVRSWAQGTRADSSLAPEVAAILTTDLERRHQAGSLTATVDGLLGRHERISDGTSTIRLDDLLARVRHHQSEVVPGFREFQAKRHELIDEARTRLRLAEYVPEVMSGFVRNRLVDEVYLPLIGDNLAKQLGTVGAGRVDQSGLLLLISPPGYGKTTLMEYVADRLGLVFVKVNGPALGHAVTSLDPTEAPDATSRQEVERINFAFEMGNNVLLYLDDIQHTNPELLQKFISLSDGQRRVEGVWEGRTRTYDMRGKRFAVVMAGNPYTESGEAFTIPDMLANRADTWNLGDVLSGREAVFALSYLQNALTSNAVLAPLAGRSVEDLERLVEMVEAEARGETVPSESLDHPYSAAELDQILRVVGHLVRVQQVVLSVNQQYIASAAQADEFRTEPPFRLQGSYRNMNRLAEKVLPVMTTDEIEALLDDHYVGEAQTLASGAEENLLKLAELRDTLTDVERQRWEELTDAFVRNRGGDAGDPLAMALERLDSTMREVLDITTLVGQVSERLRARGERLELLSTIERLEQHLDEPERDPDGASVDEPNDSE